MVESPLKKFGFLKEIPPKGYKKTKFLVPPPKGSEMLFGVQWTKKGGRNQKRNLKTREVGMTGLWRQLD